MKVTLSLLCLFCCGASLALAEAAPRPIPAAARVAFHAQQLAPHVVADPDYYCWGLTAFRWKDGRVHAYYSRWPKKSTFAGWMTHCEIAHAVADSPEGPFQFQNVVIESRHAGGWDIVSAHNPAVCVAGDKIHLYYISNDLRGEFEESPGEKPPYPSDAWLKKNRELVRNRQCIGVASASAPEGPFTRHPEPVVKPDNRLFKNIAVNPAVAFCEGRYLMIFKGDSMKHKKWFRIQLVGQSDRAEGPFAFQETPIYEKTQTEDACLWFDRGDNQFHTVFHVMGQPNLAHMTSQDGIEWHEAKPFVFMKKQFALSDGAVWKPRRVERPFVLTGADGRAEWIYLAIQGEGGTGNIAVPLTGH